MEKEYGPEKMRRFLTATGKVPMTHVDGQSHRDRSRSAAGFEHDSKPVVEHQVLGSLEPGRCVLARLRYACTQRQDDARNQTHRHAIKRSTRVEEVDSSS